MAKLAGVRKVVTGLLTERVVSHPRQPGMPRTQFAPTGVGHYFNQTANIIERLRELLADLYGDFQQIAVEPTLQVYVSGQTQYVYGREQIEQLGRDIDQVFEIRSNSELSQPAAAQPAAEPKRVFISHGRANDWREVQAYIEKDIGLATLELAQEPSAGQTIIEKLERNASSCDSAVIVMTGDDMDDAGKARVRENVMHEIGFFQAKYGRSRVCVLHEEGVTIPTNLSGVVYVPFPSGNVGAAFGVLIRELKASYKVC
ncbi:nucleotide-binding protein [Paraburkholderia sp. JPY169]|uniref:Nucleotide-binding protein n=2 Tax=Paraburkholderia youngii TaxID=2782701 RepID=A0A7Y6K0X0_9BURK|nr:nucleotide-binding protein [Paraburkholderia youngii]